jgi:formylmethanofuran dehydrogenase subunit B
VSAQPTQASPAASPGPLPWTCPFCALHCDGFEPQAQGGRFSLQGTDCARAQAGLSHFAAQAQAAPALIGGVPAPLEAALAAAAALLAQARLPLFGGLVTDIAGSRALYTLANASGAILDHANGEAQMHGLRALQDRGLLTTTLAEVREHADLMVCLGTQPGQRYPEFFHRCGFGREATGRVRHVVFLGALPPAEGLAPGVQVSHVRLEGDVFDTLALLNALAAGRSLREPAPPVLQGLAQRLQEARYAVLVWDMVQAPPHSALVAQGLHRLVDTLNRGTRAAALLLGGNDGAQSVNQTLTWLSGLPLRTGVLARGLTHEPVLFAADRLLRQQAVDALLWVASFGPEPALPPTPLHCVVLGHPALVAQASRPGCVFIPVSTPGLGSAGHLSRFDSVVVLPLRPLRADGLPTVAEVARRLADLVAAAKKGQA